jgi:hypothetical protein
MISKPNGTFGANRAPILCQDYHYLQIDQNELSLEPHHLRVPSVASKAIFEPMIRLAQTVHQSYLKISTTTEWTEMSFHLSSSLGVPSGVSKTISEPIVRLAQTRHLSCIKISTISKRTDARFNITHVT